MKIRNIFLPLTGIAAVSCSNAGEELPNIIYVFPDQFRISSLAFWDSPEYEGAVNWKADPVQTPNLDSFADESLVLNSAVSTCPLSSPHRGMLLTGMYPERNGVTLNCMALRPESTLNPEATCISDVLDEAGYYCGYIGKLHAETPMKNDPANPGHYVSDRNPEWDAYTPPERRHGFRYWYSYGTFDVHKDPHYWDTEGVRHDPKEYSVKHETDKAIEFLRNANGERDADKPFFLMLSNSFMPDDQTNAIGTMSGSLAGIAGLEFLSNQISNLISGSNYNIRFGYRPQSELTSEEVTFDVGADIIANKLSVEVGGNYDVGQRGAYTTTNNPLSVDGYVTWVLNKSGSLKLKGFTRTIDRFDESQGLQDNGVGIYYRQEFQSWKDLQQRYRAWREAVRLRRAVRQEKRFEKRQLKKAGRFEPEDTSGSVPEEAKDTVAVDAVLPSDTTRVGAPVSGDGARRAK